MAVVGVNLSVADATRFDGAMAEAEQLGLKVEQSSADLGTANGLIDEDGLGELRKVKGLSVQGEVVVPVVVNEHAHGHPATEGTDK